MSAPTDVRRSRPDAGAPQHRRSAPPQSPDVARPVQQQRPQPQLLPPQLTPRDPGLRAEPADRAGPARATPVGEPRAQPRHGAHRARRDPGRDGLRGVPPRPGEPRRPPAVRPGDHRGERAGRPGAAVDVDDPVRRCGPPGLRVPPHAGHPVRPGHDRARGLTDQPHRWPMHVRGRRVEVEVFISVYARSCRRSRHRRAAVAMRGEHRTWVLDDGRSDDVQALAAQLGARYVRRPVVARRQGRQHNHGPDPGQGPTTTRVRRRTSTRAGVPVRDHAVLRGRHHAFVQTPQTYGNLHNPGVPRRRLHADGVSQVHPALPERFNAASASAPNASSAARRDRHIAACTPTRSPRRLDQP